MNMSESLTLLALIMALSAYIGSVRARMLDRANSADPAEKCKQVGAVARLMWIDVPLVLSGLLLLLYLMMWQLIDFRADGVLSAALLVFARATSLADARDRFFPDPDSRCGAGHHRHAAESKRSLQWVSRVSASASTAPPALTSSHTKAAWYAAAS